VAEKITGQPTPDSVRHNSADPRNITSSPGP
jgi:hypothetical protein